MKSFYGTRLSENMAKTPEGYLICYDVNIARIGTQEYLGSELGVNDEIVVVNRLPDEVFKPATVASFEGKPFTNDHPFELLDVSNTSIYEKGHVQNVRISDDKMYLVADIIVTDLQTITDIENGKRELSAGYNCDCEQDEDGNWYQCNIIGNHVALVDKGRAGNKVRINDTQDNAIIVNKEKEQKPMKTKNNVLGKLLKSFAQDAEPEEMLEAVKAVQGEDEEPKADDRLEKLETRVAEIAEKLDKLYLAEKKEEQGEMHALDELEQEIVDECEVKEEVKDEDADNDPKLIEAIAEKAQADEDEVETIKKEIADAKKVIAKIEDKDTRLAVADSLAKVIRGKMKSSENYKKLMDASKKKAVADSKAVDYSAVFKAIKENNFRK